MIRVAAGERLPLKQEDIKAKVRRPACALLLSRPLCSWG